MRFLSVEFLRLALIVTLLGAFPNQSLKAQSSPTAINSASTAPTSAAPAAPTAIKTAASGSLLTLRAVSTTDIVSESGGAFMSGSKCDADGNLYIRKYASDRPLLGPVVKINSDGKRVATFDPAMFSSLALDRADAFTPAPDGGLYQIAQSGIVKPHIYVLHFSPDGTPASPTRLDADFEVYTFAAFSGGNFLISGVRRDVQKKEDNGQSITAVFLADGREQAQLLLQKPAPKPAVPLTAPSKIETKKDAKPGAAASAVANQEGTSGTVAKGFENQALTLDLSDAEPGEDGNLYVLRRSNPAQVYVVSASGKIQKTLKIASGLSGAMPSAFHLSGNRLAISFWNDQDQSQTLVVADAQTGRKIESYSAAGELGPQFACYSANDGVFTFLKLGEGNALQVIRAEAQ